MTNILSDITLLNNILLLGFFVGFALIFFVAHRNPKSTLDWTDMLLDGKTGKLSLAKLGNFFGIAISSWIMIYFVQVKEAYSMYPMLFGAWLAFLGGVYTFGQYLKSKDTARLEEERLEEQRRRDYGSGNYGSGNYGSENYGSENYGSEDYGLREQELEQRLEEQRRRDYRLGDHRLGE